MDRKRAHLKFQLNRNNRNYQKTTCANHNALASLIFHSQQKLRNFGEIKSQAHFFA